MVPSRSVTAAATANERTEALIQDSGATFSLSRTDIHTDAHHETAPGLVRDNVDGQSNGDGKCSDHYREQPAVDSRQHVVGRHRGRVDVRERLVDFIGEDRDGQGTGRNGQQRGHDGVRIRSSRLAQPISCSMFKAVGAYEPAC
jgi:hypothetical protein